MSPQTVVDQLARADREYRELCAHSKYPDCSDKPDNEITRVNTLLSATIERIAPPASRYRIETERIMKMFGVTNAICLAHLYGIVSALRSDVEAGYLQSFTELIHADIFSDFLSMAEYLLKEGYKEAAAVLTGGVLEEHLRKLAIKHGIPLEQDSRPVKADRLNASLAAASIYSVLDQKNVIAWLDLRNKAAHGKHAEYTTEQVALMLQGVTHFTARLPA